VVVVELTAVELWTDKLSIQIDLIPIQANMHVLSFEIPTIPRNIIQILLIPPSVRQIIVVVAVRLRNRFRNVIYFDFSILITFADILTRLTVPEL